MDFDPSINFRQPHALKWVWIQERMLLFCLCVCVWFSLHACKDFCVPQVLSLQQFSRKTNRWGYEHIQAHTQRHTLVSSDPSSCSVVFFLPLSACLLSSLGDPHILNSYRMKHSAAQLLSAVSILNRCVEVKQTRHDSWIASRTDSAYQIWKLTVTKTSLIWNNVELPWS